MSSHFKATWILPIIFAFTGFCLGDLNTTYEWKYIDYVWQTHSQKAHAIATGGYKHDKIITVDIQPLSGA